VQGYLDLGAVGVIAKPFDPMTLADQLREIWARVAKSKDLAHFLSLGYGDAATAKK
jgi:DNA-binding response OmpR family regulator